MTSKENQEPKSPTDSTFEQTDASPRAITWAAIGLLVLLVLASLIVSGVRYYFSPSGPNYRSAMASQKHLFEQREPLKQALPGVAIQPQKQLQKVRQAEQHKLSQYLWADSNQTVAWIPIERAAEIIAAENQDADATGGDD